MLRVPFLVCSLLFGFDPWGTFTSLGSLQAGQQSPCIQLEFHSGWRGDFVAVTDEHQLHSFQPQKFIPTQLGRLRV